MTAPQWSLDELVRRVSVALADPAYPGAPNGRVRGLPDRRAVRWYTTTGVVDRPLAQGRAALYGPRHLLQIVAVKRLQAQGRSLAEIQAELAGASDHTLREIADVPAAVLSGVGDADAVLPEEPTRARFWAQRPAPAPAARAARTDSVTTLTAVQLGGGVAVLLPGTPSAGDVAAIHAAAQPLIDLLADRGLYSTEETEPS